MNGTVKQSKISFPEQYRPGILLGYQKSQTFLGKVSIKKEHRYCMDLNARNGVKHIQNAIATIITIATRSLPQSKYLF